MVHVVLRCIIACDGIYFGSQVEDPPLKWSAILLSITYGAILELVQMLRFIVE